MDCHDGLCHTRRSPFASVPAPGVAVPNRLLLQHGELLCCGEAPNAISFLCPRVWPMSRRVAPPAF